ncbi:2Fe-2S iron-sulfur cluster-binding protein [Polyangium sp. 15x6]|uniref:2Fe-2S iron-sulfur cluster-binding protein n=1 Tax=Polyangium sp. 15x6 TaxID=3042687 RepID=UPI00249C03D4|nr:2Fe-2S iron-sulfur cluster-binding protein [Polyangium sp. 15x6]MDI3286957.1 2Fe-2S iron-sulfur cluster-binding protein [Polyangium sp. 15x6]
MAKVRFLAHGSTYDVEVPIGTSLLEAARKVEAPEGSACGGVCACSTCHVYVLRGKELLSEAEEDEEDILDKAFDVRLNSRLGCQAKIRREGDIEAEITRESLDAFYNEHPQYPDPRKKKS